MMAASLYEQGDRYGDSYDITYRNADNESRVVHQLNWGIAARVLGLHLMANADDKGFRIPPDLSPIQVAFIPVVDEDIVRDMCRDFAATIDARTAVDDKGELYERFERWEQRGVPLRIEVGPEEVEDGTVTVFRRDTDTRTTIPADSDNIESMLDEITYDDTTVAPETVEVTEKSQIKEVVESGNVAEFGYCGDENCGREIESNMDGEILGTDVYINKQGTCLVCNTITSDITYDSRRY